MTKQGKRDKGGTMRVVKEQVTICPYMNFLERTVLTRFTARITVIRAVAYLSKVAPMAKFKCAPFLII